MHFSIQVAPVRNTQHICILFRALHFTYTIFHIFNRHRRLLREPARPAAGSSPPALRSALAAAPQPPAAAAVAVFDVATLYQPTDSSNEKVLAGRFSCNRRAIFNMLQQSRPCAASTLRLSEKPEHYLLEGSEPSSK